MHDMFNITRHHQEKETTPASMDLPGLYFMLLSCSNVTPKAALMKKKPFLAVRDGFTVVAFDHRSSRTSQKG